MCLHSLNRNIKLRVICLHTCNIGTELISRAHVTKMQRKRYTQAPFLIGILRSVTGTDAGYCGMSTVKNWIC